jgi:hypothetical protein
LPHGGGGGGSGVGDQKTFKFFVCHWEEFMVGINGVSLKLGKGNTKGSIVGPRWNLEAERMCFPSPGAFKTYADLWEGKNQVISSNNQ